MNAGTLWQCNGPQVDSPTAYAVFDNVTVKTASEPSTIVTSLIDTVGGVPFPVPQSGVEVIWNHILRYRAEIAERRRRPVGYAVAVQVGIVALAVDF